MKTEYYIIDEAGRIHSRHKTEGAAYARLAANERHNARTADTDEHRIVASKATVRYYRDTLKVWSKFPC
jgi:hypothetical protein